jgi:Glycosyltransferase family 87
MVTGLDRPDQRGRGATGGFFTARWLGWCALVVVCGYAAALIWEGDWHKWYVNIDGNCKDFLGFWTTSRLALSGTAAQIYDPDIFSRAIALVAPVKCLVAGTVDYPPTLLFFTYPLGLMSYPIALAVWLAITLLLYLTAVYAIIPRVAALLVALSVWPVYQNIVLGHVGFLTAGLFGLALASMERRPLLSGICVGLLIYKPQFGILFPVALLASRNWRVFFAATATGVLFAAAAVAFGSEVWPLFLKAIFERAAVLDNDPGSARWLLSIFGALRRAGFSADLAWAAQLGVIAAMACIVWMLWARPIPHTLKAAALGVAALLASPHSFQYDFCILPIAAAFLVKDGLAHEFRRGERGTLLAGWFALRMIGAFPAILCVVLLALVVRRALLFRPILGGPLPALPTMSDAEGQAGSATRPTNARNRAFPGG